MQKLSFGYFNNLNLSLRGVSILAVDDHADCRDFLSMLFQLYEADAKVVSSASQAFDVFLQFQPQILVIDIAMPVVDGFGLLESIRRLEAAKQSQPKTPAIAMTAVVTDMICQKTYQAGYQSLFPKPIDIDAFIATIANITCAAARCYRFS
ncbi:MAG: response regulator [Scytonema sp. PMC 1069.18]|nr:response regulator [Scytonema sp. PMC 1069.18]MEC4879868.1 response regulator [Scytonema sp. PMC 1070.18]